MWSIVYDISNRASFEELEWWFAERSRFAPESAVKVIVGNKADNVNSSPFPKPLYMLTVGPTGRYAAGANQGGCRVRSS